MLDRENNEDTVMPHAPAELLEAVQGLKSVVLLLKGLYGQLNEEREVITLASGQMAHSVKQFEQYLTQFEAFEKSCKQGIIEQVRAELKQKIRDSAQTIAQEVAELTYEPIKQGINSLSQLSEEMTEYRTKQKNSWRGALALFFSAALFSGAISALTVHYLTSPSREIKVKVAAGEALMRSWKSLSKSEKENVLKAK